MIRIVTNEEIDRIIEEAKKLFPVDAEYSGECSETGVYQVIDMNEEARDAWIDAKVEELENQPA